MTTLLPQFLPEDIYVARKFGVNNIGACTIDFTRQMGKESGTDLDMEGGGGGGGGWYKS